MKLFQTIIHPTDFDEPSKEAFRLARSLAQTLEARIVVFHVVPPPAVVAQDGRVFRNPKDSTPVDLWSEYQLLQTDAPAVSIQYVVMVGSAADAKDMLQAKVHEYGDGVLVVMGSHGRTGLSHLLWGSKAEEVMRDIACPVLVAKAPARTGLPKTEPRSTSKVTVPHEQSRAK